MSGEPQTDGTYHEVGSFYVVPCVRAGWPNIDDKPRWWPILGPQHEDGEFINFPYQHFHVDYPFWTPRLGSWCRWRWVAAWPFRPS